MRITRFAPSGERVAAEVDEKPPWQPLQEVDGKPLSRVEIVNISSSSEATMQLVHIAAGGSFAMHSGPERAFCQVVSGKGKLGLPGGEAIDYAGPELFVFEPATPHDWHDVAADTLLAVCLVTVEP